MVVDGGGWWRVVVRGGWVASMDTQHFGIVIKQKWFSNGKSQFEETTSVTMTLIKKKFHHDNNVSNCPYHPSTLSSIAHSSFHYIYYINNYYSYPFLLEAESHKIQKNNQTKRLTFLQGIVDYFNIL